MSSTLIDTLTELSQAQVKVEKAWAAYRRAAEEAHYAAPCPAAGALSCSAASAYDHHLAIAYGRRLEL